VEDGNRYHPCALFSLLNHGLRNSLGGWLIDSHIGGKG